jgi:hypothetical protein
MTDMKAMSPKTKLMHWSVTDGRERIGHVELRKGKFVAIDIKDRIVGKFATLHEAMNSIRSIKEKCDKQNKSSD